MLRFASPYYLALLLLLPLVFWRSRRRDRQRPALGMTAVEGAAGISPPAWPHLRWVPPAAKWAAAVMLILAMARLPGSAVATGPRTDGGNIVLAIDVSASMGANDIVWQGGRISRLEAIQKITRDFSTGQPGDRVAVVLFGTEAFTRLPLTRDYAAVSAVISNLQLGAAGGRTALGDAIGIALKRLEANAGVPGAVLLLTDGRHNAGRLRPLPAAALAAERGIRIHAAGIGGRGPVRFLMQHPRWGRRWVERQADLDEATLRAVAAATGGRYQRIGDVDHLQQIWEQIGARQSRQRTQPSAAGQPEACSLPLLLALGLLALAAAIENTRFLRLP
jgi:Ca-activated chloride channel family protein